MPCQLPDDLSCVTDDVFSYMCSLAMEKCSKKSEKKKASCGGAAMRKRLLIKNFVAQMLAQERQNCGAYSMCANNKDEYEVTEMEDNGLLAQIPINHGLNSAMEVDADEEEDDDDEDDDDEINDSFVPSSSTQPVATNQGECDDEDADDEEDEDEDEDGDDNEYEDEEEDRDTRRCSASSTNCVYNNFCSMDDQCSNLMPSSSTIFMHHPNSTAAQYGVVVGNQFDESISIVACSSMMPTICAPPLYTTTHFYDSSGVAVTAVPVPCSSNSIGVAGANSMSNSIDCMNSAPRRTEWEDFHTVPPSRDYLMDDEHSHCQEGSSYMYSMYQAYPTATEMPTTVNTSLHFQPQQMTSSSAISSDNLTFSSVCAMSSSSIDNLSSDIASSEESTESSSIKSDHNGTVSATATAFAVVETLPDNFLDDTSPTNTKPVTDLNSAVIWGDGKKSNEICFWDDNNNGTDGSERKNDEMIYGSLNSIPQHMAVSSPSPPPPSSALHSLVTMVPSMIKLGNCRSEVHQNESSYRRCITDLDTNTVVEEDYSTSSVLNGGNNSPGFHQLSLGPHEYSPRKRPLSPFLIDHLGAAHEMMDDGRGTLNTGAAGNGVCSLMMLTTSPKRVKL